MIVLALLVACGAPSSAPAEPAAAADDVLALYESESDGSADAKPLPLYTAVPFQPEGRKNGDLAPVGELPTVDGATFDLASVVGGCAFALLPLTWTSASAP